MRAGVVITTSTFAEYDKAPLDILKKEGLKIALNPYRRKLNPDETIKLCAGAAGIIVGTERLDEAILKKLSSVKVISRCGAGLDNVNLRAAAMLGMKVYNTPDAPMPAVAELTVGLILNLLRRVREMDEAVKRGKWDKKMGSLLRGKKVGIIGFGRIGGSVASILKAFGCSMAYYDPFVSSHSAAGAKKTTLVRLLRDSDIVTIHANSDKKLLGEAEINLMKKGAWLVNTSRGGVVDESALYGALESGRLAGAALDVFQKEPYDGPLKKLKNVILTPHIGSYALESRVKMEIESVRNLLKGLRRRAI